MKDKRRLIKFFMEEKARAIKYYSENYYLKEDYQDIEEMPIDNIRTIFSVLKHCNINYGDCDICPHCCIFWGDCESCTYGERHRICTEDCNSTYAKSIRLIDDSCLTTIIGIDNILKLIKWNF